MQPQQLSHHTMLGRVRLFRFLFFFSANFSVRWGNSKPPQAHFTDTLQVGRGASTSLPLSDQRWVTQTGWFWIFIKRLIHQWISGTLLRFSSVPSLFTRVFLVACVALGDKISSLIYQLSRSSVCQQHNLRRSLSDFDKTWGNDASRRCAAAFAELHWLARRGAVCNYWSKQVGIFLTDWSRGRLHHLWHAVGLFLGMWLLFSPPT